MKTIARLIKLLVLVFAYQQGAVADGSITLLERVTINFKPVRAVFVVLPKSQQPLKVPALLLPGSQPGMWFVGARVPASSASIDAFYTALVEGDNGTYLTLPAQHLSEEEIRLASLDSDQLRDKLAEERASIGEWQQKAQEQAQQLARARQDAELIGNYSKVLEISDEIERTKLAITRAEDDAQNLQELVKSVSATSSVPPRNFVNRELQLTKQLVELAEASKRAEGDELQRRAGAETALQENLNMVEATRGDDPEALKRELAALRQERETLEKNTKPVHE
ncbi:MAG: hypothetical protein K1X79_03525 [Oligoflexia bacterium]|nr:hypothetical protein [Oligoflexia bacterium]